MGSPAMTITLDLPPEVEARLLAEAQDKGVPVGEVVKAYLIQHALPAKSQMSPEALDQVLDEIAGSIPKGIPPLSDEALSRESIYTREDEW